MGTITLADGRVVGFYGCTGAIYRDMAAYEAWHLSGDEAGMIESSEFADAKALLKWFRKVSGFRSLSRKLTATITAYANSPY